MIHIEWNPVAHLGPIPINWHGVGWATAFLVGGAVVRRWAAREGPATTRVEDLVIWILIGSMLGARVYFVAQNKPVEYLREPRRILAIWEGGLAFFGGLFGGIFAAWLYIRRAGLNFARVADLFAPAIAIGAAIGRIPCGLDGMDYGTPTSLPWGVVYENPAGYAPTDGVPRHPDQFYELAGNLMIAAILIKLRPRLPEGATFLLYLVLFRRVPVPSVLRARQRTRRGARAEERAMDSAGDSRGRRALVDGPPPARASLTHRFVRLLR